MSATRSFVSDWLKPDGADGSSIKRGSDQRISTKSGKIKRAIKDHGGSSRRFPMSNTFWGLAGVETDFRAMTQPVE